MSRLLAVVVELDDEASTDETRAALESVLLAMRAADIPNVRLVTAAINETAERVATALREDSA